MAESNSKYGGIPVGGSRFGGVPIDQFRDPLDQPPPIEVQQPLTLGQSALGVGEAALALGTAIPVETVRGALSGTEMLINLLRGKSDPNATKEKWEGMASSYVPRTRGGQMALEGGTYPFRKVAEGFDYVAGRVADAPLAHTMPRASGALAAAIKTTPDLVAALAGMKGTRSPTQRAADLRNIESRAANLNLDMTQPTPVQAESLADTVQGMTYGTDRYDNLDRLPRALQEARNRESGRIGQMFTEAENMGASVPSRTAGGLAQNMRDAVSGFAVDSMPAVNKLLAEADTFGIPSQASISESLGVRNAAKIDVNKIFDFRKKINQNLPSDYRSPEYSALSRMKSEVDKYLNETLANDLVSGNPEAIKKWQSAVGEWADFRTTFDDNAVIRKLQDDGATAEQVHNLLFGMGKIRAPRQAARVVDNLKTIFGEDSTEFKTIQSGLMSKLIEPLVDSQPDLAKFSKDYMAFRKNNPTLMDSIFTPDQKKVLDDAAEFASAIDKTTPLGEAQMGKIKLVWQNIVARFGVGHSIAQGAARVSIATKILEALTPNMGKSRKQAILSEMLGYDPSRNIFERSSPVKTVGTFEALSNQPDAQELARYLRSNQAQ